MQCWTFKYAWNADMWVYMDCKCQGAWTAYVWRGIISSLMCDGDRQSEKRRKAFEKIPRTKVGLDYTRRKKKKSTTWFHAIIFVSQRMSLTNLLLSFLRGCLSETVQTLLDNLLLALYFLMNVVTGWIPRLHRYHKYETSGWVFIQFAFLLCVVITCVETMIHIHLSETVDAFSAFLTGFTDPELP